MKTLKKALAMFLAAGLMFGCGSKTNDESTAPAPEAAKFAKVGLGVVSSSEDLHGTVTNESTIAAVGLDAEGKIAFLKLDVSQIGQGSDEVRTKEQKQGDYNMVKASGIGKEWFEQAAFLENYVVENGLTKADVLKLTNEEGTDLAAGCTIGIDEFLEAIEKACDNAVECECEAVGMAISASTSEKQTNTNISVVGTKDGKVVKAIIDVAQIEFGGEDMRTKVEKQGDYNMLKASGIGKEWFEQAAALEEFVVGMTASDITAIETYAKDDHHDAVPAEGTDLAAGCTISIGEFQKTLADAINAAK